MMQHINCCNGNQHELKYNSKRENEGICRCITLITLKINPSFELPETTIKKTSIIQRNSSPFYTGYVSGGLMLSCMKAHLPTKLTYMFV